MLISHTNPIKIYPDGDQWCALWGDDIQSGVAAFDPSPDVAIARLLSTPAFRAILELSLQQSIRERFSNG